jgi:serine/threonine protein kinase
MATVYKAYQASVDRYVAIKVLPSQLAESKEFAARFHQEARIIAKLEHPHILPVFDYGESDGVAYFVMRYLDAGTLKDRMETGRPLPFNEIDRIFTQLTDALSYAHGHGVVHRDLKPANALIDSQGNVFLTDFGIAKLLESASPRLTQTDAIMGTPAYISPEQAQSQPVDQRSDIYSLGIILYEMVTGGVPFTADTPLAVLFKHISDPLPLPSKVKPDIPAKSSGPFRDCCRISRRMETRPGGKGNDSSRARDGFHPFLTARSRQSASTETGADAESHIQISTTDRLNPWLPGRCLFLILRCCRCFDCFQLARLIVPQPSHTDGIRHFCPNDKRTGSDHRG